MSSFFYVSTTISVQVHTLPSIVYKLSTYLYKRKRKGTTIAAVQVEAMTMIILIHSPTFSSSSHLRGHAKKNSCHSFLILLSVRASILIIYLMFSQSALVHQPQSPILPTARSLVDS